MKQFFYIVLALIAFSSVACNKIDESYYLQGTWARYDDQTTPIVSGTKSEFVVWTFYSSHLNQQLVKGKYENGAIFGLIDETRQAENTTFDYTYKDKKLTYNKTQVEIDLVDDNHFVVDGTVRWTKLKDMKTPVFDDAAQIDLSKYNIKGDTACWLVYKKYNTKTETRYMWGNEYDIASDVKLQLSAAQAQSTELACYWDLTTYSNQLACESYNKK